MRESSNLKLKPKIIRELDLIEQSQFAWKLRRQGVSLTEIAQQLGVSITRVTRLIDDQKKRWQTETICDTASWITEAIAELRQIAAEAWQGWKRSCEPKESIERTNTLDGRSRTKRKSENQCGDTSFLDAIKDCIRKEGELRGIYRQEVNITQQIAMIQQNRTAAELVKSMDATMFPPSVVYAQYEKTIEQIESLNEHASLNGYASNSHDSNQSHFADNFNGNGQSVE